MPVEMFPSYFVWSIHFSVKHKDRLIWEFGKSRQMLFSILKLLSLYEWESIRPLMVRSLKMGYPVYFTLLATFFI